MNIIKISLERAPVLQHVAKRAQILRLEFWPAAELLFTSHAPRHRAADTTKPLKSLIVQAALLQPYIPGIGPDIRIRPVRQRVDPSLIVLIAGLEYSALFTVVKRHDDAVAALFVRCDLQLIALFPPSHTLILAHAQR